MNSCVVLYNSMWWWYLLVWIFLSFISFWHSFYSSTSSVIFIFVRIYFISVFIWTYCITIRRHWLRVLCVLYTRVFDMYRYRMCESVESSHRPFRWILESNTDSTYSDTCVVKVWTRVCVRFILHVIILLI